jgi:hypothetical protein
MKNLLTIVLIAAMSIGVNAQAAKAGTTKQNPNIIPITKTPYAIKRDCVENANEHICTTTYSDGTKITIKSQRK